MNELTTVNNLDVMSLGEVLQRSGYFADVKEASQAVVKILAGQELGIGPIAAMTGIYIVKGRVTLSANLMAAQIKRSGRYDYRITRMDDTGCEIAFYQDNELIGTSSFVDTDAKAAGLLGGDNWRKFPRNMYFARAMSNGAKWYCPDVFAGPVYTPDELQPSASYVDAATGEIIDTPPMEEPRQPPRNAPVKAPEKVADAPKATKPPMTRADLVSALRALWFEEKDRGTDAPAIDLAWDLDNEEETSIEVIKALGKRAKERVLKLRAEQQEQPA